MKWISSGPHATRTQALQQIQYLSIGWETFLKEINENDENEGNELQLPSDSEPLKLNSLLVNGDRF